jgi:hypothetical protein
MKDSLALPATGAVFVVIHEAQASPLLVEFVLAGPCALWHG